MRKLAVVSLVGLTGLAGCANMCDRLFRARNVCRDQTAAAAPAAVVAAPPAIVIDDSTRVMSPPVIIQGAECGCVVTCVSGYPTSAVVETQQPRRHPFSSMFSRQQ